MIATLRHAHAPLVLMALLAAYGSLYPFRFVAPASFEMALRALFAQTQWWTSRGDVAGNVVLFVPIGVAIVYATARCSGLWRRRALYVCAVALFALLLQIAQIYLPARTAALSDALWNTVGAVIGIALGQAVLSRLPRWSLQGDHYTALVLLVIASWLGWRLWPFEPAFGVPQVYRTIKPLLRLDPIHPWSLASMAVSLILIAAVVERLRHAWRWLLGAAALGLAVRFVLAGQAISTSVLLGTLIGLSLGLIVQRVGLARAAPWVIALAMIWYSAESLRPFLFMPRPAAFSWLPFAATLRGAMDINLASLCGMVFLSGALMLIGTRLTPVPGRWAVLLGAWLLLLELIQRWIPTRTSDLTPALMPFAWWVAIRSLAAAQIPAHDAIPAPSTVSTTGR